MNYTREEATLEDVPTFRDRTIEWQARVAQIDRIPWLIVGFAALFRFFLLAIKPPHFDEGINGWFVDQLIKNGFYRYDPTNYHGPLHFYILFLSQTLLGRNLWALRLPVVLASTACVWLSLKFEPFIGRNASRLTAIAMAISPGFVFYGRYSIHEIWQVLFSMTFILGVLGLWRTGTPKYLWCTGMGLTGMILTKETYTLHVACALLAIPPTILTGLTIQLALPNTRKKGFQTIKGRYLIPAFGALFILGFFINASWNVYLRLVSVIFVVLLAFFPPNILFKVDPESGEMSPARQTWDLADLIVVVGTGVALIVFFYSGTFFHWAGVKGLYQSYSAWFATGSEGHGHEKPYYYWLKLVIRYEWPVLIGLVLCLFASLFRNVAVRFLAIYGLGTFVAYSIVHYKTPWCIISVVWPFLFIFGAAVAAEPIRKRIFYGALCAVAGAIFGLFISYFFLTSEVRHALGDKSYFSAVFELIVLNSGGDFSTRIDNAFFITVMICMAMGGLTGIAVEIMTGADWFSQTVMKGIRNLAVGVALLMSITLMIALNYFRCTNDTEPYVYVQTYNDIFKLTRPVLELARRSPAYYQLKGHIIRTSSYPLPWIFGDFPHIGYYEHEGSLPSPVDADFLLVQPERVEEVESKLHNTYFTEPLTIRPYQETSKVYFDATRFEKFFPGRAPNFHGTAPAPTPVPIQARVPGG